MKKILTCILAVLGIVTAVSVTGAPAKPDKKPMTERPDMEQIKREVTDPASK